MELTKHRSLRMVGTGAREAGGSVSKKEARIISVINEAKIDKACLSRGARYYAPKPLCTLSYLRSLFWKIFYLKRPLQGYIEFVRMYATPRRTWFRSAFYYILSVRLVSLYLSCKSQFPRYFDDIDMFWSKCERCWTCFGSDHFCDPVPRIKRYFEKSLCQ